MKIAIVNKQSKRVEYAYESDKIEQGTNMFGGAWDDSSRYEHVKIPTDLINEPWSNLEPYDGEEQVGTQMVQSGEEQAFDAQQRPIKGLLGQVQMIPKFVEQPVMEPKRLMRKKQ